MLAHFMAWGWAGALVIRFSTQGTRLARGSIAALSAIGALCAVAFAGSAVRTALATPSSYSWSNYLEWNDCIERSIASTGYAAPARVWQAFLPDALAEAGFRLKGVEAIRGSVPGEDADFVLVNRVVAENIDEKYEGPEREEDRARLSAMSIDLGDLKRYSWKSCQYGPFWVDIGIKAR
jgi:hypothetical protein